MNISRNREATLKHVADVREGFQDYATALVMSCLTSILRASDLSGIMKDGTMLLHALKTDRILQASGRKLRQHLLQ